jgi:hypothetical protein
MLFNTDEENHIRLQVDKIMVEFPSRDLVREMIEKSYRKGWLDGRKHLRLEAQRVVVASETESKKDG